MDIYTGTLVFRDIEFSFIFDKQELRLVPPVDKKREVEKWFLKSIGGNGKFDVYTQGDPIYIEKPLVSNSCNGTCQIVFIPCYNQNIGRKNSIITVQIQAYFYFKISNNGIRKLAFECPEINSIYSTRYALDNSTFEEDGTFLIKTKKNDAKLIKKQAFTIKGKKIEFYFDVFQKTTTDVSKPPLSLQSCLIFKFDATYDFDFIYGLYQIAKTYIQYLCYRKDIFFNNIIVYTQLNDEQKSLYKNGNLNIVNCEHDIDEKRIKEGRTIKHSYISDVGGSILSEIVKNTLYLRHLPENYEYGRHITVARFVMITAAFEWEFKKLYPNGIVKKDVLIKAEETATITLNSLIKKSSGKLKSLYKSFLKNGIGFVSLQTKIVQVGKDLNTIIEPFGKYLFSINNKELNYSKMGERLAKQRNHYAHGDLDEEFIGDSLLDLIFLERIIYAMQLKRLGVSDKNIQKSINDLFRCNIMIID